MPTFIFFFLWLKCCTFAEKHPSPFNDAVVIYVRNVGPGVMVGQAWQEGEDLNQVPKKLCSEILMVKDYSHLGKSW